MSKLAALLLQHHEVSKVYSDICAAPTGQSKVSAALPLRPDRQLR